jgi:chromosome segregation ATPase
MTKKNDTRKVNVEYGYFSKLLKEPFDTIEELQEAEEAYYAKQKAKEDAAAQKKTDALKVEAAFKALNAARKTYKEELTQLTKEYAESLDNLKKAFELGKKDIHNQLAEAEEAYQAALKEFDTAHPEGYHVTLHDGDFETTLSKQTSGGGSNRPTNILDILDIASIFGL